MEILDPGERRTELRVCDARQDTESRRRNEDVQVSSREMRRLHEA